MSDFASDRRSGSAAVAIGLLDALERWTAEDRSPDTPALCHALLAWLRAAQAAQPTMALVHQLAARALAVAETGLSRGDSPAQVRRELAASVAAERHDLAASQEAMARTAAQLVTSESPWIATLSHSASVRAALVKLKQDGRKPRVLLAESRPGLEGRDMAAALAAEGIESWLVADAALPMLLQQAQAVWLGADAVTELGVLNKIGSYMLALAAREHSVPCWALATRRRFLPAGTPALAIAEQPGAELWEAPPERVRPRNVLFELVPLDLLRGVVVEDTVLGPSEVGITASDRALPEALAKAAGAGAVER